jgi:hypothetical protein
LNTAIGAAKGTANPVVQLTSAFYTSATTPIIVDVGSDNATAYTIKGTGKNSTDVLNVGILLANSNVTLQDVNINITEWNKGSPTEWTGSYTAGVAVGRYSGSAFTGATDNVTVKNTAIQFTGDQNYTAGIYVSGRGINNTVTLIGNTVSVTGYNDQAAQALIIGRYNPNITITGNILHSTNTTSGGGTAAVGAWNKPAGALYLQLDPRDVTSSSAVNISDNTLDGVFDFYIVTRSTGDFIGIQSLFDKNFGTASSTWATGGEADFYKNLLNALSSQAKSAGFGLFQMHIGGAAGDGTDTNSPIEQYEITDGEVTAIDYWGPTITSGSYDTQNVKGGTQGNRGRINVSGTSGTEWHWTRGYVPGTSANY